MKHKFWVIVWILVLIMSQPAAAKEETVRIDVTVDSPFEEESEIAVTSNNQTRIVRIGESSRIELEYDQPGTYEWKIQKQPGHDSRVNYDRSVYEVNVMVDSSFTPTVVIRKENSEVKEDAVRFIDRCPECELHPGTMTEDSFPWGWGLLGSVSVILWFVFRKKRGDEYEEE